MKNRTSLFCFLTLILCLGATAMSHGEAVVSISPSPVASPAVGSKLKVNIHISGASGVAGYECSVEFDTSALTYVSAANAIYLPAGAFAPGPRVSGNRVTLIAAAGSAATKSSGTLATVTFRVAAVKASELRLQDVVLSNVAWRNLARSTVNGQVVKSIGAADVNQDGQVDDSDLELVSQSLGSRSPANPRVDVNGDGQVDVSDLALVSRNLSEGAPDNGGGDGDTGGKEEVVTDGDASGKEEVVADRDAGDQEEVVAEIPKPEGMVRIPAGQFQMGGNDGDAQNDERPVHTVHINAFFMDEHEVTNSEYKAFLLENPSWQKKQIDKRFHNGEYLKHWSDDNNYPSGKADHPVTYVSWYAAMAYAEWAGKRLPTEAEWEYAARGGLEGQKYPSGNTLSTGEANYNRHVGDTTPVGQYAANGYGLYDMAGNVWEWCLDAYDAGFYSASRNSRNPISGARTLRWILDNFTNVQTNSSRVLRGGSWYNSAQFLRVANRNGNPPTNTPAFNGFRCARGVTP